MTDKEIWGELSSRRIRLAALCRELGLNRSAMSRAKNEPLSPLRRAVLLLAIERNKLIKSLTETLNEI